MRSSREQQTMDGEPKCHDATPQLSEGELLGNETLPSIAEGGVMTDELLKRRVESETVIDAQPVCKRLRRGIVSEETVGGLEVGQLVYYLTNDPTKKKELELMCCTDYTGGDGTEELTYTLRYWAGNGNSRFTGKGYISSSVEVRESEFANQIFLNKKDGMDYLRKHDPEALAKMEREEDHCQFKTGQSVYRVGKKNIPCGYLPNEVKCDITAYEIRDYQLCPALERGETVEKEVNRTYLAMTQDEPGRYETWVFQGDCTCVTRDYELAQLHAQYLGQNSPFATPFVQVGQTLWQKEKEGERIHPLIVVKITHEDDGSTLGKFSYVGEYVNRKLTGSKKSLTFTEENIYGVPGKRGEAIDSAKKVLYVDHYKAGITENASVMMENDGTKFGADVFEGTKVGDKMYYVGVGNSRVYPGSRFNHWMYKLDYKDWTVKEIVEDEEETPYHRVYVCTREGTSTTMRFADYGDYTFLIPEHAFLKAKCIAYMNPPIRKVEKSGSGEAFTCFSFNLGLT